MIIQTLDKNYHVVKRCKAEGKAEIYICKDSENRGLVTLMRTRDRALITKAMGCFTGPASIKEFTDFKGYFVSGDYFCAALAYHEGVSLKKRLERENSLLEERMELFLHLLETIILQNIPSYFLCDVLNEEQVIVSPSLEISFNYQFQHLGEWESFDDSLVKERLSGLLHLLFAKEFQRRLAPPLLEFAEQLRSDKDMFPEIMDIYRGYLAVTKQMAALSSEELKQPGTWPFRMWEKIKKLGRPLKNVIGAALLTAAIVYLIFTVKEAGLDGESQTVFRSIGVMEIEE